MIGLAHARNSNTSYNSKKFVVSIYLQQTHFDFFKEHYLFCLIKKTCSPSLLASSYLLPLCIFLLIYILYQHFLYSVRNPRRLWLTMLSYLSFCYKCYSIFSAFTAEWEQSFLFSLCGVLPMISRFDLKEKSMLMFLGKSYGIIFNRLTKWFGPFVLKRRKMFKSSARLH